VKLFIKNWFPPALLGFIRKFRNSSISFDGHFDSWKAASARCSGYDADNILSKVLESAMKVKKGEAAYERDSVLFDEIQYSWPVTAGLMWAAARNKGKLDVLDFGGSLGSIYFQNRTFLLGIPEVRWSVIEQENHVKAGQKYIQENSLRFYSSIDSCLKENSPNVVLLSSVLQYLEKPYDLFERLSESNAELIIIYRTPFKAGDDDKIFIQKTSKRIYEASYPMRVFGKSKFMSIANKNWRLISEEVSPEGEFTVNNIKFSFVGMIFEKKI
jgi:putative methyltransferase (TIGR04325 family)